MTPDGTHSPPSSAVVAESVGRRMVRTNFHRPKWVGTANLSVASSQPELRGWGARTPSGVAGRALAACIRRGTRWDTFGKASCARVFREGAENSARGGRAPHPTSGFRLSRAAHSYLPGHTRWRRSAETPLRSAGSWPASPTPGACREAYGTRGRAGSVCQMRIWPRSSPATRRLPSGLNATLKIAPGPDGRVSMGARA